MGTDDRTIVYLGNRGAVEIIDDPDDVAAATAEGRAPRRIRRQLPSGKRCTTYVSAPGLSLMQCAQEIADAQNGVWQAHSDGSAPAWVASTNPDLARLLGAHFGCEVRDPEPGHQPTPADAAVLAEAEAAAAGQPADAPTEG